ncbi:hypothetical protein HHL17_21445 [Chitinophaga sp. G-6-1-13]|uniref:Uncharacterized protein n=1 Tax=Chitinophaga fulva TaxID=2728842 RepID=A0A848GVQ6_9BACT|nr:hypothetical protein [Chitinophaga fulva]NML39778.1 hypothetical protein [Chitinophaga fulva]
MTLTEAFITAARRYCKEHHTRWTRRYSKERTGTNDPVYSLSDQDYDFLSRYHVLAAILDEVEKLVGKTFPSLEACRETLFHIGLTARSLFTESDHPIAIAARQEEREHFVQYLQSMTPKTLAQVAPLPYRRRLNEEESSIVRQQLLERWHYDSSHWAPLAGNIPSNTLFVAQSALTPADRSAVTGYICQHAMPHLFEITADHTDAEITCSELDTNCYATVYCDENYNWLIYGSHESTLTFAGEQLLLFVRQLFTGRERVLNQWP